MVLRPVPRFAPRSRVVLKGSTAVKEKENGGGRAVVFCLKTPLIP